MVNAYNMVRLEAGRVVAKRTGWVVLTASDGSNFAAFRRDRMASTDMALTDNSHSMGTSVLPMLISVVVDGMKGIQRGGKAR